MIAESLAQDSDVVSFDEPTRGVDVGVNANTPAEIKRLADAAKAVLVISTYLPEVQAHAGRILVAKQGKVATASQRQKLLRKVS